MRYKDVRDITGCKDVLFTFIKCRKVKQPNKTLKKKRRRRKRKKKSKNMNIDHEFFPYPVFKYPFNYVTLILLF